MDTIIRNIVGREHVSTSNRAIARIVANKIKGWRTLDAGTRLYVVSCAIECHRGNVALFKRYRF